MKRLNILWIGLISVLMTACYDDYEKDYDKSSVYFASQKPLRTLVADTDMSIKVGVAIGCLLYTSGSYLSLSLALA